MKVACFVGHPAHVHIFRNTLGLLASRGHEVLVLARDKELVCQLLDAYEIDYQRLGGYAPGIGGVLRHEPGVELRLLWWLKQFRADVLVGATGAQPAFAAKGVGVPYIALADTEIAGLIKRLSFPLASAILTPQCFESRVDPRKWVAVNGYFELAYLHPNRFTPDERVVSHFGLDAADPYVVVRLSAKRASHDMLDAGLGLRGTEPLVAFLQEMERFGRVCVSSEVPLPNRLKRYALIGPVNEMHHVLAFARGYLGDGAKSAAEAALLGTPSVFVSQSRRGYLNDLEKRYGLVTSVSTAAEGVVRLNEFVEPRGARKRWSEKRKAMLADVVDVTAFLTDFIENYPESFARYRAGGTP